MGVTGVMALLVAVGAQTPSRVRIPEPPPSPMPRAHGLRCRRCPAHRGERGHLRIEVESSRRLPSTARAQRVERSRQQLRDAAARHGVSNLRLFGSSARGDDRPESDIDLLVHLDRRLGLIGLARLQHELQEILGAPVDLVPDDGLKPDVRAAIERDAAAL